MTPTTDRSHRRPRRAALGLAAVLALALPISASAAGALDQQQTAFGNAKGLIGTHENGQDVRHAQQFRAGVTGVLDQVDLAVRVAGDPGVPLTVEIRTLDGNGFPAAVLASATVPQASIPTCTAACPDDFTTFEFVSVPLSPGASVSAGTDYAIVLSATGAQLDIYGEMSGRSINRYDWAATTDVSAYSPGDGLSYLGGVGWIPSNVDKTFRTYVAPSYTATVRQPINADGSSNFRAGRGVIPVKFELSLNGSPTCELPPATIVVTKTSGADAGPVNESVYVLAADSGSSFRITDCQYHYNLGAKTLTPGMYEVAIQVGGVTVGTAQFELR